MAALSKGLNFAHVPGPIPTAHFISNVEAAICGTGVSKKVAAKARLNVIGAVSRAKMPPRNVPSKEVKALKDHARDEDILLLPGDKAKATVVMDRADSDEKMLKMLNEKSTYQPVEKDPTASLERKMNVQLMNLKRSPQRGVCTTEELGS